MSRLPQIPQRPVRATLRALKAQQRTQGTASSHALSGSTITAEGAQVLTGSLTVAGEVTVLDEDGSVLFKIGTQEHGDRGIALFRDDGSRALVVKRTFSAADSRQALRFYDADGRITGGDSILSFAGFDAPHVPIPFTPVDVASSAHAQATSSATFVPLFEHYGYRQNPGLQLKVKAWCSNGTTSADIQVWDVLGGVYLETYEGLPPATVINVPTGTTTPTVFTFDSSVLPGQMSDPMRLEIHAKVTAGAGSVSVAVLQSFGTGI